MGAGGLGRGRSLCGQLGAPLEIGFSKEPNYTLLDCTSSFASGRDTDPLQKATGRAQMYFCPSAHAFLGDMGWDKGQASTARSGIDLPAHMDCQAEFGPIIAIFAPNKRLIQSLDVTAVCTYCPPGSCPLWVASPCHNQWRLLASALDGAVSGLFFLEAQSSGEKFRHRVRDPKCFVWQERGLLGPGVAEGTRQKVREWG